MPEGASSQSGDEITVYLNPEVSNDELNALFSAAWSGHVQGNFQATLRHSLAYVCAYTEGRLVGFAKLAWDGGVHAFLLDITVHPEVQRRGVGTLLVKKAVEVSQAEGMHWLHVDYEPHLEEFYKRCGFRSTKAGLIHL